MSAHPTFTAQGRQTVFVVRDIHDGSPFGRKVVLVVGERFEVNKYLLASLERGTTPEELDLSQSKMTRTER